jgi:hypothetical protein
MVKQKSRRERLESAIRLYKTELRDGFEETISSAVKQLSEEVNDLKYEMESWADNLAYTNLEKAPIVGLVRDCENKLEKVLDFLNNLSARNIPLETLIPKISEVKFPSMIQRYHRR